MWHFAVHTVWIKCHQGRGWWRVAWTKISYLENHGERRTLGFQWSSHHKRPTNKIPNRTVFAFVMVVECTCLDIIPLTHKVSSSTKTKECKSYWIVFTMSRLLSTSSRLFESLVSSWFPWAVVVRFVIVLTKSLMIFVFSSALNWDPTPASLEARCDERARAQTFLVSVESQY